jgi:rod shape-determining protein MreD
MRIFLFIISLLLVVSLQVAFLPNFRIYQATPNLILVIIVSWCILSIAGQNYNQAYLWAVFGGVGLDLFSGTLFGLHALSLVCTVLITYIITQYFLNKEDLFSKLAIIILTTVGYELVFLGFLSLTKVLHFQENNIFLSKEYFHFLLWQILVNAIALFIIFPLIKLSHNFLARYEKINRTKIL